MLDGDLSMLYGVETRTLIQAVKRNIERFPDDFMFQLTKEEFENWKSQFVTSNSLRSQFVISKGRGGRRYLPYAFTDYGVAMLSSVLKSPQAVKINIEIMRAFTKLRHMLSTHKKLSKEMEELKSFMLKHSHKNDQEFKKIWNMLKKLMTPAENQRKIGFNLN